MANETLNKVAAYEGARRGVVAKSLNWGPWEGGMVTPALKAHFDAMGVPLIPLEVGAGMLVRELSSASQTAEAPEGTVEVSLGGEPRPESISAPSGESDTSRFPIWVHRDAQPFLDDHRVKGTVVVPVVLVLEWFARAARAVRPDLHFAACRDVRVHKGVTLSNFDGVGDRLEVQATKLQNGAGAIYALELRGPAGALHYRATAHLERERVPGDSVPPPAPPKGLDPIRGALYSDGVLFHGEGFQVIHDVELGPEGAAAAVSGTREKAWRGDAVESWQTDPALLDGGLQMALLWTERELGKPSLPTSVGALHVYQPGAPVGPLRATLRGVEASGSRAVADVAFVDASGDLVAALERVETHVLPG